MMTSTSEIIYKLRSLVLYTMIYLYQQSTTITPIYNSLIPECFSTPIHTELRILSSISQATSLSTTSELLPNSKLVIKSPPEYLVWQYSLALQIKIQYCYIYAILKF